MRAVMKAKGLSQPKVAARAKLKGYPIDQTTVGRVANVAFPATVDTLEAIANGLDIDPWKLIFPDLKPESLPLSEAEREQLEQAKTSIAGLSPAQRDLFLQDDLVRKLLTAEPVPDSKLEPNWIRPDKRPLVRGTDRAKQHKNGRKRGSG